MATNQDKPEEPAGEPEQHRASEEHQQGDLPVSAPGTSGGGLQNLKPAPRRVQRVTLKDLDQDFTRDDLANMRERLRMWVIKMVVGSAVGALFYSLAALLLLVYLPCPNAEARRDAMLSYAALITLISTFLYGYERHLRNGGNGGEGGSGWPQGRSGGKRSAAPDDGSDDDSDAAGP